MLFGYLRLLGEGSQTLNRKHCPLNRQPVLGFRSQGSEHLKQNAFARVKPPPAVGCRNQREAMPSGDAPALPYREMQESSVQGLLPYRVQFKLILNPKPTIWERVPICILWAMVWGLGLFQRVYIGLKFKADGFHKV